MNLYSKFSILLDFYFRNQYLPNVKIFNSIDTINKCESIVKHKKRGAYLRFGDGDLNLAFNINDQYQQHNPDIAKEMKVALNLSGKNIIKTLPIHSERFGYDNHMTPGMHLQSNEAALLMLKKVYKFFNPDEIYSPVALHYIYSFDRVRFNSFIRLLNKYTVIFISNSTINKLVSKKLFPKSVTIDTSSSNAYDEIDSVERRIIKAISKNVEYKIIILACGCTSRILAKRLIQSEYDHFFVLDVGSVVDAIAGINSREWIKISNRLNNT